MNYIPFMVCVQLFLAGMVLASPLRVGDGVPAFEVYGGKSVPLNSWSLKGKVLIITYETKDVVDKNKKFKDRVLEYLSGNDKRSTVAIVPVINCFNPEFAVAICCSLKILAATLVSQFCSST
jgi:hypothetical protein